MQIFLTPSIQPCSLLQSDPLVAPSTPGGCSSAPSPPASGAGCVASCVTNSAACHASDYIRNRDCETPNVLRRLGYVSTDPTQPLSVILGVVPPEVAGTGLPPGSLPSPAMPVPAPPSRAPTRSSLSAVLSLLPDSSASSAPCPPRRLRPLTYRRPLVRQSRRSRPLERAYCWTSRHRDHPRQRRSRPNPCSLWKKGCGRLRTLTLSRWTHFSKMHLNSKKFPCAMMLRGST